ncbi:nucleotidyltransferase family protein [Niallia circulans]|uniref:nucleotidyltransferase family protein n=1 Tax=Niallia circulans TaxID=1397 RepID=UPI00352485A5
MKKWENILIPPNTSIMQTMKVIDDSALQFAVVVDENRRILGTVTDGDIRRGILKGVSLDTSIQKIMNNFPKYEQSGYEKTYYRDLMRRLKLRQLPIVNDKKVLLEILFSDDVVRVQKKENIVILMVGGLGTRLRPLTEYIPKPMLKVGEKPILETIIENFKSFGFTNFILSVNYKKEIIKDYFQDGFHLNVNISYIEETKRLGTAGALSLLMEKPLHPFIVMNGDLLTKINYEQLLNFHQDMNSIATMCVREYEYQVPYGVVETNAHRLLSIKEKPVYKSFVNSGIYVLNSEVLDYIPQNEFYDMPDLYRTLMSKKKEVAAFPLREYWLDIGQMNDYEQAKYDYSEDFYD